MARTAISPTVPCTRDAECGGHSRVGRKAEMWYAGWDKTEIALRSATRFANRCVLSSSECRCTQICHLPAYESNDWLDSLLARMSSVERVRDRVCILVESVRYKYDLIGIYNTKTATVFCITELSRFSYIPYNGTKWIDNCVNSLKSNALFYIISALHALN